MNILDFVQYEKTRKYKGKSSIVYSTGKSFVAVLEAIVNSAISGNPIVITKDIERFFFAPDQSFYVSKVEKSEPDTCIYTWISEAFVANFEYLFNNDNDDKLSSALSRLKRNQKRCIIDNMPPEEENKPTLPKVKKLLEESLENKITKAQ